MAEPTSCPRCNHKSNSANCPSCKFPKWKNPARNTHNKMCKCQKCKLKREAKAKDRKPRVRGK